MDIKKLIKEANDNSLDPSQKIFVSSSTDFIHHSPPEKKLKSSISGRSKRHNFRKAKGIKTGFGKAYSSNSVFFRIEFSWRDEEEEETNEQVHWCECRKFRDREYQRLRRKFDRVKTYWRKRETVESEFVYRYVGNFLIVNHQKIHLNQAFIYPACTAKNDVIREPLYRLHWYDEGEKTEVDICDDYKILFKKNIWHEFPKTK